MPKRRRAPTSVDLYTTRIAAKLAIFQKAAPREVIVPHAIARAARDIEAAAQLARRVLRGERGANELLTGKLGGSAPLTPGQRLESRPMGARAAALLAMTQNGPVAGLPCRDQVHGDLELLQAAFRLDAEAGYRDGRMTTRAARFIREARDRLAGFDGRLDRLLALVPDAGLVRGPGTGRVGDRGAGGVLPPDGDLPVPGTGRGPGRDESPLFPPADAGRILPDQPEPDLPSDLCIELSDLCAELFNEFAIASLAEDDTQLIAAVNPDCVCAGGYDETTIFTALPDRFRRFPADRGDRRLIFTGESNDGDITDRIVVPNGWSETAIRFTIPADSETGYVYLRRFVNSASAGLSRTLANLCGVPDFGAPGRGLSPSPRALLGIIRAPVIESFTVGDATAGTVTTEACTALTLHWGVRLEDLDLGLLLPPCSRITVEVRDAEGAVLHRSEDPVGSWVDNPGADVTYHLRAESWAGETRCGQAASEAIEVRREHQVHLEPREPGTASIVAGRTGTLTVRLSCAAPPGGALVELLSSDRDVLRLPDSALVLPGEVSAPVQFGTDRDHPGEVVVTARLAGHIDGTLRYEVVENLTAIVLSGGGAKGSFQVGALLYLREIWHEIAPRIICGTSVGAINALALAESTSPSGVDKIEGIWLGLQYNQDMYVPSEPLQRASDLLGFSITDVVFHGGGVPSLGSIYQDLIGLDSEAAAWSAAGLAVGGDFGALVGGLARIFIGKPVDDVHDAVQALRRDASFLLDLQPTEDKIKAAVDRTAVANSGMKLRLATVALEDGALYYVTEAGRLLRGRAVNADFDEPITTSDPLVAAAMASAAIPAFFAARRLDTASTAWHHVDGGTREMLPAQAAVELGAQLLYNISVSPSIPLPAPDPGQSFGDPGRLLTIAGRGLDLLTNEVAVEEKHPRAGFCDERERLLIQPVFEVHDTVVIDPGLIRINMAYGYFRAFDAERLRRGEVGPLEYLLWVLWTDDLIRERLRCHQLELHEQMVYARHTGFFNHSILEQIRGCKNWVAELIVERFERFGSDAFPRRLADSTMGNQSALDWCDTWEIHQDPQRTFLNSVDLWAAQIIAPGIAGEDGPSAPPIREASVLARFPLPAAVRDGLRNR
jgi:NTE family protein